MQTVDQTSKECNSQTTGGEISLTRADRRLLLGASLRLLGYRFSHGKAIRQDDVIRIASFADDVQECSV